MYLFWAILFLIFLFIEIVTINLVSIWFAVAALVTSIVALFTDSVLIQTIVFIVTSIISLLLTKPIMKKFKVINFEPTNLDRVVGKKGEVISKITPKKNGQVKVMGSTWTAYSEEELEVGEDIVVLKIDGVKLLVKKEEK